MAKTIAYLPAGPTYAITTAATQSAALAVLYAGNTQAYCAEFTNMGATPVCVTIAPLQASGTAATPVLVFPVAGTPTVPNSFILPGTTAGAFSKIIEVPTANGGFSVSAIGTAAGTIYITPVIPV